MDKRFFLALVLTAAVIVVVPLLFPSAERRAVVTTVNDSTPRAARATDSVPRVATQRAADTATRSASSGAGATTVAVPPVRAETTTLHARHATYAFTSHGALPIAATLDSYPSRRPASTAGAVHLVPPGGALLRLRLAQERDTIALDTLPFRVEHADAASLTYATSVNGAALRVTYAVVPDSFLLRVGTRVTGASPRSALLIELPRTLRSNEPDTLDDLNHLAVSYRSRGDVSNVPFSKLDSTQLRTESGPLDWVAARNKYFLVALRSEAKRPFAELRLRGVSHTSKVATQASATAVLPLGADGSATADVYAGPQDFERLQRLGRDLDQVNPYAGWLHGVVQPFTTIVMKALLWMKRTTQLNYGWVLILFGILIRLALWPLNQSAMRTSMKMQRLQPELQALQKKYTDDPKRQQEAIMKVYQDHGMSPLSPLMGCLPMLIPMPVLFALYYVFNNTIEFRGVSFLWLPDLSLRDPYYITPVVMGLTMFLMSWIGLRGSPPNPQAKMMSYMMPAVMTAVFLNFASGLNLYYAVQNLASIPQQWLLARERMKAGPAPVSAPSAAAPAIKRRS